MRGPDIVYENIIIKAICDMINNIPPNTTHRRAITTRLLFYTEVIQLQYDSIQQDDTPGSFLSALMHILIPQSPVMIKLCLTPLTDPFI